MAFVETGWVKGYGGERWHKVEANIPGWNFAEPYMPTTAGAGAAELALSLYRVTHKAHYLRWGLRTLSWLRSHLKAPSQLYYDHMAIINHKPVVESAPPGTWQEEKTESEYGTGVEWFVSNRIASIRSEEHTSELQ